MKNMKLNEAEMASIYGGSREVEMEIVDEYGCATQCGPCHKAQPAAKEAYREHQTTADRNWGR